jgi:diguanylate cyclase (GGDEF)-like protein
VKSIPLRWLIITPFVLLAMISGITMYVVSSVTIANITDNVGFQYIDEVKHRIQDRVKSFSAPLISLLEINRDVITQNPKLLNDLEGFSVRLYEQALPFQHMTFISVATPDGRYITSSHDPLGKTQYHLAANFINDAFTMEAYEYDPLNIIGPKIETEPTFSYDPRTRPFYSDAINAGKMVWSDIYPYYGTGVLGVGLSVPIYDERDKLLGVTATSIALVELDRYLESLDLVDKAYVFLAEVDGALIATSGQDDLYPDKNDKLQRVHLYNHPTTLLQLASQKLEIGAHQLSVEGEKYLYYLAPVELDYEKTWLIGILIPASYHEAALAEYTQTSIFITLGLFVCIGFIGSMIAWYIGKPIHALNNAANDKKVTSILMLPQPMSRIREINSLSQGLHSMASNLVDILQNLEDKVSQRTSHLQDENETLIESAITDELTSLFNRRGFNQAFEMEIESGLKNKRQLTVVIGDIDHFKGINDKFGHALGDEALVSVANILKKHTRSSIDIVARYGGEEFIIVFVGVNQNQVMKRLNSIQREFAASPVFDNQHITMSFGVVSAQNVSSTSKELMIEQADKKLYEAKNSGRNKIIF